MRPDRDNRPARDFRAASGDFTPTVQQPADGSVQVTATVRVDLSAQAFDDRLDRHALFALDDVPPGARVVVWIGDRTWLWPSTADLLHKHAARLLIELHGTPRAALRRWLTAARTGQLEVLP